MLSHVACAYAKVHAVAIWEHRHSIVDALPGATAVASALGTSELQVYCYEDSKLLKLFSQILRILYDADVLGEDAILFWYKRGSHPKGRNVFLHDVEPFIKWLEEAEEEGEEEE